MAVSKMIFDYDNDADVLYVAFGRTTARCVYVETKNDVVLRVDPKSDRIVGMTIPSFSSRRELPVPGVDVVASCSHPSRHTRAHGAQS